jgi:hypothetical protein
MAFPGGTAAVFKKIFTLIESLLFISEGLFFLKKNAQEINDEPIKPVRIGQNCRKDPHHKRRNHTRQGRFSFPTGSLRRSTGLAAGK